MSAGLVVALGFGFAVILVAWVLRRFDREGHWDREGHGTPGHEADLTRLGGKSDSGVRP